MIGLVGPCFDCGTPMMIEDSVVVRRFKSQDSLEFSVTRVCFECAAGDGYTPISRGCNCNNGNQNCGGGA